jgi:hypothetical protein
VISVYLHIRVASGKFKSRLKPQKKILSILIKILVGLGSFGIIYFRLENDLTQERLSIISASLSTPSSLAIIAFCLLLIPVNWGLESYKWQLITAPVEKVSYRTATKSVYAGVFLGNLAPGRATEFVAKIIFFYIANRSKITVLHFVNGMFQLAITIIAGFAALAYRLHDMSGNGNWMIITTSIVGTLLLAALVIAILKIDYLLNVISRKISKEKNAEHFHYSFTGKVIFRLFFFSALRYMVFFAQFALLLYVFFPFYMSATIFSGIALYFLITSTIPMISVLEAAIRAAVALVVFRNAGIDDATLALTSVLVWLTNIIIPSVAGYYILLRQNFNFKLFRSSR